MGAVTGKTKRDEREVSEYMEVLEGRVPGERMEALHLLSPNLALRISSIRLFQSCFLYVNW